MALDRERARQSLRTFDFRRLFIDQLGWDKYTSDLDKTLDGRTYPFKAVSEKRGVVVLICDFVPEYSTRAKLDRLIAKDHFEHLLIFADRSHGRQVWQWMRRESGKPNAIRAYTYSTGQTGELLLQKLEHLVVTLEEEEQTGLADVLGRMRTGFDVEKVTKKFYERFKAEHERFLKFVDGIPDNHMEAWYASVMINRLMFLYFIQAKNFLNGDMDYLRNKLKESSDRKKDGYYRDFLCPLFFEGFARKKVERSAAVNKLLGNVPYLNGGLFQRHQIEDLHGKKLQIADIAFEHLFSFFKEYSWHLDERENRDDKEINPDVLGYIFEKYINQKQMGAYYTKEDITGYISQNTIIPFLLNSARRDCAVAFDKGGSAWRLLRDDPDRYIYQPVRHGTGLPLPTQIAAGLSDVNKRTVWNKPAPPEFGLPTEIWREVVERRRRYEEVRRRLAQGEVHEINDLVTLNLDIRQFAQDIVQYCEGPELLRALYKAISKVSVLDPTCGSGAFLFAALNILKGLYEACLQRMQMFVDELNAGPPHHAKKFEDLRHLLEESKQHPKQDYFILKSIIVNNLYGVDIMEEAVEICKLRLFLKLVAQVDSQDGIEPLPDIDFSICAGNTLIGYARYVDVGSAFGGRLDFENALARIEDRAKTLDSAVEAFRLQQTRLNGTVTTNDKVELRQRFRELDEELDDALSSEHGIKKADVRSWQDTQKPFHWFSDFHRIMTEGGFDVVIGNPPYVEIPKSANRSYLRREFRTVLPVWSRDEDLYTIVVERSLSLLQSRGAFGMILPLSAAFSTKKPFVELRRCFGREPGTWWWSHFDRIPCALFGNEVRTRCTISLLVRTDSGNNDRRATTQLIRWTRDQREELFQLLGYSTIKSSIEAGIPKVGSQTQADTLAALEALNRPLSQDQAISIPFSTLSAASPHFPEPCVFVGGTAYNWFPAWRDIPATTDEKGRPSLPARTACLKFASEAEADAVFALLCSSLGYWWWAVASDGFNLKKWLLDRFPVGFASFSSAGSQILSDLGKALRKSLRQHYVYKDNKGRKGNYHLPSCSDEIFDIDSVLVKHVPHLSFEFFEDIRGFNQSFGRNSEETDEGADGTDAEY